MPTSQRLFRWRRKRSGLVSLWVELARRTFHKLIRIFLQTTYATHLILAFSTMTMWAPQFRHSALQKQLVDTYKPPWRVVIYLQIEARMDTAPQMTTQYLEPCYQSVSIAWQVPPIPSIWQIVSIMLSSPFSLYTDYLPSSNSTTSWVLTTAPSRNTYRAPGQRFFYADYQHYLPRLQSTKWQSQKERTHSFRNHRYCCWTWGFCFDTCCSPLYLLAETPG